MTAVITGVGVVSAFGVGAEVFYEGLSEGRSGIRHIEWFDATTFPTRVAGEVSRADFSTASVLDRLTASGPNATLIELKRTGGLRDRKVGLALLATAEAVRSAGDGVAIAEAGLSIALGLEQAFLEDFAPVLVRRDGTALIDWEAAQHAALPEVRFRAPVDLAARAVSSMFGLQGPEAVHVSACAAGGLAVAHAASLVERGAASIVLCGGSDSMVNPLAIGGMSRLGAPSPRDALDACRPFDRRRDGLVIGEGAAMFVVEDEGRARARGALSLARILGWGSTQDAYRATAPRPDGEAARRAMARAMARARRAPSDIGYVNAHGTGTPLNDPAEARAIRGALGASTDGVPVSSIKGAVGHLMAAAGAIELAACLMAFQSDLLPGTANHRERDPECDIDVIGERPRRAHVETVLSNSFGFGGQNVTVALGRAE